MCDSCLRFMQNMLICRKFEQTMHCNDASCDLNHAIAWHVAKRFALTNTHRFAYSVAFTVLFLMPLSAFAQQTQTQAQAPADNALQPAAPPHAESGPVQHSDSVAALPHEGSDALSHSDEGFVETAAHGGIAEMQLAQLAQQTSPNDQVRQFARKMIDDHTPNNQQLVKLAERPRCPTRGKVSEAALG